jgi:hypothetical protein
MSAADFMTMFHDMLDEMLGGGESLEELFEGMTAADVRSMPPFPFPERLFPRGTFPPVRRCGALRCAGAACAALRLATGARRRACASARR